MGSTWRMFIDRDDERSVREATSCTMRGEKVLRVSGRLDFRNEGAKKGRDARVTMEGERFSRIQINEMTVAKKEYSADKMSVNRMSDDKDQRRGLERKDLTRSS